MIPTRFLKYNGNLVLLLGNMEYQTHISLKPAVRIVRWIRKCTSIPLYDDDDIAL